jgi:urease accessory protein
LEQQQNKSSKNSALRQTAYGQIHAKGSRNQPGVFRIANMMCCARKISKGILMFKRLSISTALLAAMSAPAFAHLDSAEHGSLMAGLSHPLSGADHMLAMIAVGLWAAQIGGSAKWIVPASFVAMMAAGFLLAMNAVALPFVEPAILASVIGLGLLVALAVRVPVPLSAAIVGVFALFHGHAHGGELGGATPLSFALGFVVATAVLHALGVGLGMTVASRHQTLARLLGAATAAGGAALIFG